MTDARPRIGFIGAGRVAGALSLTLSEAGYDVVAVSSRSIESAQALASIIRGCRAVRPQEAVDGCDLLFLTVPDAVIGEVCDSLAWRKGVSVVHTSGAQSSAALASAARQGAATGSLHPLQTFADHAQARLNLPGSVFAVEAESGLRDRLLGIVADMRGTPIELRAEDKALYHASAVIISNYTVTLAKMASDLWLRFGWERGAAVRALLPLLKGAVNNIDSLGVPLALTGPIARGDVATVRNNVEALKTAAAGMLPAYIEMARQTVPVALARGGLTEAAAAELIALLDHEGERAGPAPATGEGTRNT